MEYLLSYTATSLSIVETEMMANLFLETKDWQKVEERVLGENLLQKTSQAAQKREFREIRLRLQNLTDEELRFFTEANSDEIRLLCMLAAVKSYRLIKEFLIEVMRNKLLLFDYQILHSDYAAFYDSKKADDERLETLSESTQKKLQQVMYRMFAESGLIDSTKNKMILRPYLSEALIETIVHDDPKLLAAFLYANNDIEAYTKKYA